MAIKRLFVANRGEIALRVIRAAHALGLEAILGVSDADRDSAASRLADGVLVLGAAPAAKSYLDARRVVHAAKASGCDALHPGYGFLSERAILPRLCAEHGVTFVGPDALMMETLGDKLSARAAARAADSMRAKLHAAAVKLAKSVIYRNAGTAEFLYDVARQSFYFIEVNARIQVEHPVTEMVTGVDLVEEQLRVAGGSGLSVSQDRICLSGHAIECRINSEDVVRGFIPVPGTVTTWNAPSGEGIRLDSHISQGATIPPFYDSMIGKLIVHGATRAQAVQRMSKALDRFVVEGVPTTIALLRAIVGDADFINNKLHTRWLEKVFLFGNSAVCGAAA
jgi:acetyl/propionyl-CoA carboxylase alpha subunit